MRCAICRRFVEGDGAPADEFDAPGSADRGCRGADIGGIDSGGFISSGTGETRGHGSDCSEKQGTTRSFQMQPANRRFQGAVDAGLFRCRPMSRGRTNGSFSISYSRNSRTKLFWLWRSSSSEPSKTRRPSSSMRKVVLGLVCPAGSGTMRFCSASKRWLQRVKAS